MRIWFLFPLLPLAACAGNVADYVGPRAGIVTPQLIRFGFDLEQSRCVGEAMGGRCDRSIFGAWRAPPRCGAPRRSGDRLTPQDLDAARPCRSPLAVPA